MTLTIYSHKKLIQIEIGHFAVDRIRIQGVSKWRLIQALFTHTLKGEWPPKQKAAKPEE